MSLNGYLIFPNFFAPKCNKYITDDNPTKIHAISYGICNFNCNYCSFSKQNADGGFYLWKDAEKFSKKVDSLMPLGKSFKFTGGEPTINPLLERDIEIVKNKGGTIYLDTNGSNCKVVENLLNKDLIDVLAISIKGLTKEEAIRNSQCSSVSLCWDNVWKSIELGTKSKNTEVIVTYVCNQYFSYEKLCDFAKKLNAFDNVYLKINNYQEDNGLEGNGWKAYNEEQLENDVKKLVEEDPKWKNRIIVIHNSSAIQRFDKVQLF